jgi:hypothetical protein
MLVGEARDAARDWVRQYAAGRAAFLAGSAAHRDARAEQPAWSDVDVRVVVAGPAGVKPGKLRHEGALLDVDLVPEEELADAGRVAESFHLAPCFAVDGVLADPTGLLRRLRAAIAPAFGQPESVRRRCADVVARVEQRLCALDTARSWPELLLSWLFPASLVTHIVLVAALRPPTVRLRYLATREVLNVEGRADLHERLLGLLGCADVPRNVVERHLDRLAEIFDAAAGAAHTPFPFSSDITPVARPIAIDGSRRLVEDGDHREAVFWIAATYARCQQILDADAPEPLRRAGEADFRAAVLELLGVQSAADVRQRAQDARPFVADLQPAITGKWSSMEIN